MTRIQMWTTLVGIALAVVSLVILVGCGGDVENAGELNGPLVLRSYAVDPDLSSELSTILNDSFSRGENEVPLGRASVAPGGRLIVAAPSSFHEALEDLIPDIEKAAGSAPPVIAITYWVVRSIPSDETTWSGRLGEIESALESIVSAEGPSAFTIVEKAQLRSLSGERAQTNAAMYRIDQRATERDGRVFAEVGLYPLNGSSGRMSTKIALRPDQLVILGQTGATGDGDTMESLYIIVRVGLDA